MSLNKETAVPDASVGTDAGQLSQSYNTNITDSSQDCNEEIENHEAYMKKLQRLQDPTILNTITYNDLMDEILPDPKGCHREHDEYRRLSSSWCFQNRKIFSGGTDCLSCQYR